MNILHKQFKLFFHFAFCTSLDLLDSSHTSINCYFSLSFNLIFTMLPYLPSKYFRSWCFKIHFQPIDSVSYVCTNKKTISCAKLIRASINFLFGVFTLLLSYLYYSSYFFRWRSTSLDKYSPSFYEIWWVLLLVTNLLRLNCNEAVHIVDNLYDAPEWARRK